MSGQVFVLDGNPEGARTESVTKITIKRDFEITTINSFEVTFENQDVRVEAQRHGDGLDGKVSRLEIQ